MKMRPDEPSPRLVGEASSMLWEKAKNNIGRNFPLGNPYTGIVCVLEPEWHEGCITMRMTNM